MSVRSRSKVMQVTCWDRRTRTDGRGIERVEWFQKRKDDHYSDCEQMQVVCAAGTDLLSMPADLPLFADDPREDPGDDTPGEGRAG